MPALNLRKHLYDELVRRGDDPTEAANKAVVEYLRTEHGVEIDQ